MFLAYTDDAFSADATGLVLTFGLGAILGPMLTGWTMQRVDPYAFWLVLGATFAAISLYALYRMSRRAPVPAAVTESYLGVVPTASPVAVEAAAGWAADQGGSDRDDDARP